MKNAVMKNIEAWYISYALLGAAAAGVIPILLPLNIAPAAGPTQVGLIMAAFSLGGLTAPLWGRLADRRRLHRPLLAGGLIGLAVGAAAIPEAHSLATLLALSLLQGTGLAASSTVAILFIVEVHPKGQWDARIGWLQSFYAGGQVVGLLAAGALGAGAAGAGLWIAGGLAALAIIPALLGTPPIPAAPLDKRPALAHPARHAEWPGGSPQRMYHHAGGGSFKWLRASMNPRFALFLVGWLVSFAGSAAFFSLYPVLMRNEYGVAPGLSSVSFAVAAAAGLLLYAPAGRWAAKKSPLPLLRAGLGVRTAAFVLLWGITLAPLHFRGWPALAGFLLVVLAWSFLGVGSTAQVAELSHQEGEGMGIFNAVTAIAGVIGAAAGGGAAGALGYVAVPVLAIGGSILGLVALEVYR
jgi:MFS transporter, DHA1 family, tetracycline resistance protein